MRYAIYALLVLLGIGGVLLGVSGISDPRREAESILFVLIGTVALSGLGVVMAIENALAVMRPKVEKARGAAAVEK